MAPPSFEEKYMVPRARSAKRMKTPARREGKA
jgi:hypothetical protein